MPTKSVTAILPLILIAVTAQAGWLENDRNPVFSPPGGAAWPSVVHDPASFAGAGPAAQWKMWFTRGDDATATVAHATSTDGRTWTELSGDLGLPAGMVAPRVVHDPARFGEGPAGPLYKMWVSDRTGVAASIRLFDSDDGLAWTDRGVVIDGITESAHMWNLAVAYRPAAGNTNAIDSAYLGFAGKGPTVSFFTSSDGRSWTQAQAITLAATHPAPLVLPDGTVRLFASATEFSSAGAGGLRIDQYLLRPLGDGTGFDLRLVAEGMSGVGELGGPGSWNEMAHLAPAVAFDGSAVHVFRTGSGPTGSNSVGLATTQPWSAGDTWEPPQGARGPEVLTDDASFTGFGATVRYKMWHSNDAGTAIMHAGSADGDKWNLIAPIMSGLAFGATDIEIVHDPAGFGEAPMDHAYRAIYRDPNAAPGIETFRTAKSMNGSRWFDDQPLAQSGRTVIAGPGPAWNAQPVQPVELLHDPGAPASLDTANPMNNRFVLVYAATDGLRNAWGLAFSSDGFTWQGWQDGAAPILTVGSANDWDAGNLGGGTVVARPDGRFDAWFSGGRTGVDEGVGFASSPDGLSWTRCVNNPILAFGGCGPFGGLGCVDLTGSGNGAPTAILEDVPDGGCTPRSQYRLWRGGLDSLGSSGVVSSARPARLPTSGNVLLVPAQFPTIQSAINAAAPGETVLVAGGVYDENLVVDRPLQLVGEGRDTTIVRSADASAEASAVVWIRGTDGSATDCVTISGFTFDGMKGDPLRQVGTGVRSGDTDLGAMTSEAGWAPRNTDVSLRDCRIENARHCGVLMHAAYRPVVENCIVSGLGDGFVPQNDPYVGVSILASKMPTVAGNSVDFDLDTAGLSVIEGVRLDPVNGVLWEGFTVSDNSVTGPNIGGGIVIHGDFDAEPARHAPGSRVVSGNFVDGEGAGTHGLILRGGVYGTAVRDNELRANGVNLWLSNCGAPGLETTIEGNLIRGVHVLPGDHGIYLDDENQDGQDRLHLVMTRNNVRNHSGSGIYAVSKSNLSTIVLGDAFDASLGNSFVDNCRYNIELTRDVNNPLDLPNNLSMEARHNYWGIDCGPGVQESVFDRFQLQSIGLGTITVAPWTDDKLVPIDSPESCTGPFTAKTLGLATGDDGAGRGIAPVFSYDVTAGEVAVESWIVQFPEEIVFDGFPVGPAGSWSYTGGINGSFPLIGLAPNTAYFDVDGNGSYDPEDYLVVWAAPEFQVALVLGGGPGVEPWSLVHTIELDPGLFRNPAEVGDYVIESRWRSRDGRLECSARVESVVCTLPGTAVVGTMQALKDPAGVRAFWPALDPSGLSCFAGYALLAGDDPGDLATFVDRSAADLDGVPTIFEGAFAESYFLVVAVGPDGQYGPVKQDQFLPLP